MSQARVAGGLPDGGQYAASSRAESSVELDTPTPHEPPAREALVARRDALTQTAFRLQDEADVVEMQLLAGDIEREFPGMTHLTIRVPDGGLYGTQATQVVFSQADRRYPRHLNIQSRSGNGNLKLALGNTIADRLLRIHNRSGSVLHKLSVDANPATGVPIADLHQVSRSEDAADADRESVLDDVRHWMDPVIGTARRNAAAGRPYNQHEADNRMAQLADSLISRIELDRMLRPGFDLQPAHETDEAAPVAPLAKIRKRSS